MIPMSMDELLSFGVRFQVSSLAVVTEALQPLLVYCMSNY